MTFVSNTGSNLTSASPVLDYSSRDYSSIFTDLVARIPLYLPEWTSQSMSDFGMVLLQMFAYVGDILGYYEDRLAGEAFIQTATQAVSVLNLASMLDYTPSLSAGASVTLQITIANNIVGPYTIPAGTVFSTLGSAAQAAIPFITTQPLTLAGANSATPGFSGQVPAIQGLQITNEAVAASNGSVNQAYPLLYNPVSLGFNVSVDVGLGPQEWLWAGTSKQGANSLISFGPFDQVYRTFVDANDTFYIVFGDGVNGSVPPLGSPITCAYQTNMGAVGNVGAGTIVQPSSALIGVTGVTNPSAANGGTGAESLPSIQQNAPASLKALNRVVTIDDAQTLALQAPGVQWASAIEQTYQLINLYVAPFGGGAPTVVTQDAVLNYMAGLTMANTTVTVFGPSYVGINITATVVVLPNYSNTGVQTTVTAAIANFLALVNTGFGFRVALGLLYSVILDQPGVNYAIVTGLSRQPLVTLTTGLTNASNYSSLAVTALPQVVNSGDVLTLASTSPAHTQTLTCNGIAAAGSFAIPVTLFTANAAYPIASTVSDLTGVNDAILLANEIPVLNTLTVAVSGGIVGS
jgi:hypothetical protein